MGKLGPSKRENALRVVKNRERERGQRERGFSSYSVLFFFLRCHES
jgi:hypothetical protein